jgi:hypothetical protein
VQAIDPALPIAHVRTLEQVIADSVAPAGFRWSC